MTVLMTVNQSQALASPQCRVEWQEVAAGDVLTARVSTASAGTLQFPDELVPGVRLQPFAVNAWLLDLAALPEGWQYLELLVRSERAHSVSVALEVRSAGAGTEALQHPGLTTVPGAPMVVLRIAPDGAGWRVVALTGTGVSEGVPAQLREAAALARHEGLVRNGEPVTAVVDVSASMRPRLATGTVGSVLTALQAVVGGAGGSELSVVAVSDTVHGRRSLPVAVDAEEFLCSWVQEIGLRTGQRDGVRRWIAGQELAGLTVSVSDQQLPDEELQAGTRGRRSAVVLARPGDAPVADRRGTVVITEETPSPVTVVRALAHASGTV